MDGIKESFQILKQKDIDRIQAAGKFNESG